MGIARRPGGSPKEVAMARYRIEEDTSAVSIDLSEVSEQQGQLLEAFSECQEGHCSCPTAEYEKLASIDVQRTGDDIRLRLEAKPGETIDTSQIAACLDYTTAKVQSKAGTE
jgi:hypothetical protein